MFGILNKHHHAMSISKCDAVIPIKFHVVTSIQLLSTAKTRIILSLVQQKDQHISTQK
jgi:hypothetical protein